MKIGIVTFHRAINYGAALQAWALRSYLLELGHDAEFVDYDYEFERKQRGSLWVGMNPKKILGRIKREIFGQAFGSFRRIFLGITGLPTLSITELEKRCSDFDLVISGSDQVWNPEYIASKADERVSWLDFLPAHVCKASYAASFGVENLSDSLVKCWKKYVQNFLALGVREKQGAGLIASLGRNDAVFVPDPTLLHDVSSYSKIESAAIRIKKQKFLFSFMLAEPLVGRISDDLCAKMNWRKERVGVHYVKWFFDAGIKGPGGWLGAIRHSQFVVTDSFHCLVFCLLYHKDFLLVPRTGKYSEKNVRVYSLLQQVGLMNRLVINEADVILNDPIDWDDVDKRLAQLREIGQAFLKDLLAKVAR